MTQLEATNKALANLGVAPVADLNQDTHNGRVMNRLFEGTRQSVLSDFPWRMAVRAAKPDYIGESELDGWRHKFEVPSDCINLWEVYRHGAYIVEFVVRGGHLYTNARDIVIEYNVDVAWDDWTEEAQEAFTYRLAADGAKLLTGSEQIAQTMLQKYQVFGTQAKRLTRNEQNRDYVHSGNYISVRGRGRRF